MSAPDPGMPALRFDATTFPAEFVTVPVVTLPVPAASGSVKGVKNVNTPPATAPDGFESVSVDTTLPPAISLMIPLLEPPSIAASTTAKRASTIEEE
jgi:hypothetical protein